MNLPANIAHCICLDHDRPHRLCLGNHGFKEKRQQIKLSPQRGETVKAIVLDGCLLSDPAKKSCDGLFLFCKSNKTYILLIELKGTHIEDAFEQLACVKYEHQEYVDLCKHVRENIKGQIVEKCFVITSGTMEKTIKAKLEKDWRVKVAIITQQKTKRETATPDLRKYLRIS